MLQHHLQGFLGLGHNFKACLDLGERQGLGDGVFDVDLLVGNEGQGGLQIRRCGAVGGGHGEFIAPKVGDGDGDIPIGDGKKEDNPFLIYAFKGLLHRGVGPGANNDPIHLEIQILITAQHGIGAELFGLLQAILINIGGHDPGAGQLGDLDVQDAGDAAAQDQDVVVLPDINQPQAPHRAGQGLDHGAFEIGDLLRQDIDPVIHVNPGHPDIFTIAAGIIIAGMQGVAGRMIVFPAKFAVITRHMMADKDPLAHAVLVRFGLDDLAGDLMAENPGRLGQPVPFHDIGAADAAGADLDQDLPRPDLGDGKFLQADIVIVIIFGNQHMKESFLFSVKLSIDLSFWWL